MGPPLAEGGKSIAVLTTDQEKVIIPDIPLDPNRPGQLLLWKAIEVVPVTEGPIVSER